MSELLIIGIPISVFYYISNTGRAPEREMRGKKIFMILFLSARVSKPIFRPALGHGCFHALPWNPLG